MFLRPRSYESGKPRLMVKNGEPVVPLIAANDGQSGGYAPAVVEISITINFTSGSFTSSDATSGSTSGGGSGGGGGDGWLVPGAGRFVF